MIDLLAQDPSRTSHLERSFIMQRTGMALLAAVFPFVFLGIELHFWTNGIPGLYQPLLLDPRPGKKFFVGALCAIGVFLLLYKGYNLLEDRVLDAAGIGAVGIAFFRQLKTVVAEVSPCTVCVRSLFSPASSLSAFSCQTSRCRKSLI